MLETLSIRTVYRQAERHEVESCANGAVANASVPDCSLGIIPQPKCPADKETSVTGAVQRGDSEFLV